MKTSAVLLVSAAMLLAAPDASVFQIRPVSDSPSADSETMTYRSRDGQELPLYVQKEALLDATSVQSADVARDVAGSPFNVRVTFTPQGRRRFSEVTRQNVHKRLAVIVDGKIYAAPMIQAELTGSSITISGDFATAEQASAVAAKIQHAVESK